MKHEENWIALAEILGPRSPLLKPLLEAFGTPEAIFSAGEEALLHACPDLRAGTLRALVAKRTAQNASRIALWCHRNGVRILTLDSQAYPSPLRELDEPPAVLYCRGNLPDFATRAAVGIVGTRKADAYGEHVAYKLSFELSAAGAVIVSGMADGLDGVATAAALSAGGSAIAVLGCGIDVTYPRHHGKLMKECAACGAVLTEYPPGTPPNGYNFPIRNRLISALSDALLVVQAGERSGALITARYAVMQGRVLYAVPGNIDSPLSLGSNRLLQAGARAALSSQDVLDPLLPRYHASLSQETLREAMQYSGPDPRAFSTYGIRSVQKGTQTKEGKKEKRRKRDRVSAPPAAVQEAPESAPTDALTPRQRELYLMLPDTTFAPDFLTERGVPISEAISTLTVLEIYGLLVSRPGGMYEKKVSF